MKKQRTIINLFSTVFITITFSTVYPQHQTYHDKLFDKTFVLSQKSDEIVIKFQYDTDLSTMMDIANLYNLILIKDGLEKLKFGVYEIPGGEELNEITAQLYDLPYVSGVLPVYIDQEGFERYVDPEWFTVQFVDGITESEISQIFSEWDVEIAIDHWTPGYYTVTTPTNMSVFDAVNEFMSSPLVKFTEPATYGFNDALDDTYLDQQWHLQNTGQEQYYTPGNDINIFPAWNYTFGSSNVIIVIIDYGVDLTHPDLQENILPRNGEDWDFANQDGTIVAVTDMGLIIKGHH